MVIPLCLLFILYISRLYYKGITSSLLSLHFLSHAYHVNITFVIQSIYFILYMSFAILLIYPHSLIYKTLILTVLLWGAGGTVVVHVSLTTVTGVRFRLRAVIWLKLPWWHVRRMLSSLTLPSITGFLRVVRFPPVLTLDSWGVALQGEQLV